MRVPATALRSRLFREAREADWRELERVLARLERGSIRRLTNDELVALPRLYRAALSALSTARAISLDAALVDYLEALSRRAYFAVYGVRTRPLDGVARFFGGGWPRAVRALGLETAIAAGLGAAGAVLAYLLVAASPDWLNALTTRY